MENKEQNKSKYKSNHIKNFIYVNWLNILIKRKILSDCISLFLFLQLNWLLNSDNNFIVDKAFKHTCILYCDCGVETSD